MQSQERVIECYNNTAENYAKERIDELSKKHIDALLLKEFASMNKGKGTCADFGCGPGQTTKFLFDHGLTNIKGIDISEGMIKTAKSRFPKINFECGDLLRLPYERNTFASAVAFYAIVHFNYDQVAVAFNEVNKVLRQNSQFLFSFHVGNDLIHFDKAGDVVIDVDLYFFQTERLKELLHQSGFKLLDALERLPYEEAEYPSKRGYIWAQKT